MKVQHRGVLEQDKPKECDEEGIISHDSMAELLADNRISLEQPWRLDHKEYQARQAATGDMHTIESIKNKQAAGGQEGTDLAITVLAMQANASNLTTMLSLC
jgi:hypothetical protein